VEKLVYLVFAPKESDRDALRRSLIESVAPRLLALGPRGLSLVVDDAESDVPAPVPWPKDELPLRAAVSLWLDCHDRRGPFEDVLLKQGERVHGYLVCEALYTDYGGNPHSKPRDWPDGARSPGVVTVTLLERPERMAHTDWIAHWHGVQSPVSEEIQPRTRYVRNEVVRALTAGAPRIDGIVEEAWPSARHVTDPMLFYCAGGDRDRLRRNVERMLASVRGFLDLERIRNTTMSEYLLRTQ
jgi:hypothetical protein